MIGFCYKTTKRFFPFLNDIQNIWIYLKSKITGRSISFKVLRWHCVFDNERLKFGYRKNRWLDTRSPKNIIKTIFGSTKDTLALFSLQDQTETDLTNWIYATGQNVFANFNKQFKMTYCDHFRPQSSA